MPASIVDEVDRLVEHSPVAHVPGIRIDGAHQLGDAPHEPASIGNEPQVAPVASGPESADLLEQLRRQARQLAQHLLSRQRDTDLRESRLNATQAALEKEARAERLWLLERRAELADQAEDLVRRECELQERASRVSAAEEHLAHARKQDEQSTLAGEEQLRLRGDQLEAVAARLRSQRRALKTAQRRWRAQRRRQQQSLRLARQSDQTQRAASQSMVRGLLEGVEIHRARLMEQEAALDRREAHWINAIGDQEAALEQRATEIENRRQILDMSEAALEQEWNEYRQQQAAGDAQLLAMQAQQQTAAEQAEAERQDWKARLFDEQQALSRRAHELDRRRQELEELQRGLRQMHTETLETRLAGEELMGQLAGAVPAAVLTRSISRLRRRLDDQFRLAQSDLSDQRGELESLRAALTGQHEKLLSQRLELQAWVREREATIELQASRLVAREQELDSQQEQLRTLEARWQVERQAWMQENRRLLARLRSEAQPA